MPHRPRPAGLFLQLHSQLSVFELEGKKTDPFTGPVTYGEIAYQLLNQTLVYLELVDI